MIARKECLVLRIENGNRKNKVTVRMREWEKCKSRPA